MAALGSLLGRSAVHECCALPVPCSDRFLFRARAHAHMPGEIAFFRSVSVSLLGSFLGAVLGRSWGVLGASWGGLGTILGCSWLARSFLGLLLGDLEAVLGPSWEILGRNDGKRF